MFKLKHCVHTHIHLGVLNGMVINILCNLNRPNNDCFEKLQCIMYSDVV